MVQKELLNSVQVQLTAAEEALATKQGKIDQMKQDIFQKEKELETISVFQAQVGDTWTFLHYFRSFSLTPCQQHICCGSLCVTVCSVCRQKSIPQTSMQSEQRGRSSTRRGSA